MKRQRSRLSTWLGFALVAWVVMPAALVAAWEPTKPIEFVIPAGTGGGADQMARLIAGIAEKHKLSPRPLIAINKAGGAGAEGFLDVKGKKGDAHTIIITLSNLFTTPLHNNLPFNWRDYNPIECVSHWKAGRVRPLAVFDTARIAVGDWKDIPTIKEALGVDVHYLMLRGIFGPPGMPKDAVDWYIALLKKVTETPEWKKYL